VPGGHCILIPVFMSFLENGLIVISSLAYKSSPAASGDPLVEVMPFSFFINRVSSFSFMD
jgi:hypothetical protein